MVNIQGLIECLDEDYEIFGVLENLYGKNSGVVAWGFKSYLYANDGNFLYDLNEILKKKKENGRIINPYGIYDGGVIGYISYDAVRFWEKVKDLKPPAENWPYAEFFIPENILVYEDDKFKVYGDENYAIKCLKKSSSKNGLKVSFYDESLDKEKFEKGVKEILEYIRAGYAFQVVLSRFYRFIYEGNLASFYFRLREANPSPYTYYLKFFDRKIVGTSPELLFRVQNGTVETYPIAGTRPRGRSDEEDRALEIELLNSIKDRAEHLMLLDLARNDLGKVCEAGTVTVPEMFYIEKYSHVQHIVSKVIGKLHKRHNVYDVIKAVFPAGTVSGAPKPFAMNLIEVLEEYKRGPYAGSVGFINFDGNAEFSIAIRTAFANKDLLRIQAGAGIVYDSDPTLEYMETEDKLMALKVALRVS